MRKIFAIAFAATFMGVAFAGCTSNDSGTDGGPDTGTPSGTTSPAPKALADVRPLTPTAGSNVDFDAARSLAGGVELGSLTWDFGDGATATTTKARHAYDMPGRYVVSLMVKNKDGATATNDASLTYLDVSPRAVAFSDLNEDLPPTAVIGASGQVVQPGTAVSFDGLSSYGWAKNDDYDSTQPADGSNAPATRSADVLTSYAWDFGAGSPVVGNASVAGTPSNTFENPGAYPVKLTVTAGNGKTGSAIYTIKVLAPGVPTPGGVKNPDVFTTVTINGPQSLDPGFDYETAGGTIIQSTYETLVYYDRDNFDRFIPVLAREVPTVQNGGISADGLTYTFKLREGVMFHDGTALNADAVKFSIDRAILMNDPNSAAWISGDIKGATAYMGTDGTAADRLAYLAQNGVVAVDGMTVRITLEKANPAFLAKLAFYQAAIVSPTAFKAPHAERVALWGVPTTADGLPPPALPGKARTTRDPWADTNAVGTGAFQLRAWIANDRAILDRFDGYWGSAPAMRTVIIQYVDDVNTRILMLLSGDADDAFIPANLIDKVAGKAGVRVVEVDSLIVDSIFFGQDVKEADNCPKDKTTGEADCLALADKNMRAAITHAFDKDQYVKDIWKNRATPLPSVIPIGMFGYDDSLTPYGRDLAKARDFLSKSNHPDGLTNLVLATNSANTVRMSTLQLLKQNLAEIGIEATILGLSFPDLISGFQDNKFPVWMIGWGPDYAYPDNYVIPFVDGRSGTYARGALYNDDRVNAAIDSALAEPDASAQLEHWQTANRIVYEDYVHLWLSQRQNSHVERTWVAGYYYNPMDSGSPNVGNYAAISKA